LEAVFLPLFSTSHGANESQSENTLRVDCAPPVLWSLEEMLTLPIVGSFVVVDCLRKVRQTSSP